MIQGVTVIYKVAGVTGRFPRSFMRYLARGLVRRHRLITVTVGIGCNAMHTSDPERVDDCRLGEPRHGVRLRISGNVERGVPGDEFAGSKRIA